MGNARKTILDRLRKSLSGEVRPWWTPEPEQSAPDKTPGTRYAPNTEDLFRKSLESVGGEFYQKGTLPETRRLITELLGTTGKAMASPSPALRAILNGVSPTLSWYSHRTGKDEIAAMETGITEAQTLIAETGTAIISSSMPGSGMLSLLPPTSIIIASKTSLVPDIATALAGMKQEENYTWITGPSRTADIEKVLVTGVHGPGRVIVILFDEAWLKAGE